MEKSGELTIEEVDLIIRYYEKLMVSFPDAMNLDDTLKHWQNHKSQLIRKQNEQARRLPKA